MSKTIIIILVAVVALLCCCALVAGAGAILWFYPANQTVSFDVTAQPMQEPSTTPRLVRPTPRPTLDPSPVPDSDEPAPEATDASVPHSSAVSGEPAYETLNTLNNSLVPINDIPDLARRLEDKTGIPATLPAPDTAYQVGDQETFWVTNTDNNQTFQVEASLRYVTEHAYFWIEEGVNYRERDLGDLAETFNDQIYPTNCEFFGDEWSPGVDSDPRLYILYARGIGGGIAGYFSSNDSFHPEIVQYSNGHEMFVFNADNIAFDEEFTYGVLAHEFQHMISLVSRSQRINLVERGFFGPGHALERLHNRWA